MHIKGCASIDEVMAHYDISRAEVHATLSYYYDNQAEIEHALTEAEQYAQKRGVSAQTLIDKLRKSGN